MKQILSILFLSVCLVFNASAQIDCGFQPDADGNYVIGVTDVLALLELFGQADSDMDGIWDGSDICIDVEACNYDANPSEECLYLDALGVCGGDGVLPELLLGSWKLSTDAGAVKVGSAPYSADWFSSEAFSLQSTQYDDVYTFNADGTLTTDYSGSIVNAFAGYVVEPYSCGGVSLDFAVGGGTSGEDAFTLIPNTNGCDCPFMGTNDASLSYDIVEVTETTLVLHSRTDDVNCNMTNGYFTFTFDKVVEGGGGTDDEGYVGADSYPGMELMWSDEFEGTQINSANWTYDLGASGWGNNEWQNYTSSSENSSVADGFLTITAKQEAGGGYTSARLKSVDLQEFQYGRIDIRAKLPEGQGIWPALWMLGANFPESGWPSCGEIDIMELVGHQPSTVHGTAHWGADWTQHQYTGSSISLPAGQKFSEAFHLFSIEWSENSITWLMDDQEYFSINNTQMNGQPYPFNAPFFFIMNIAVGGNWPGYPDGTTSFPQTMVVDYVRVFQ